MLDKNLNLVQENHAFVRWDEIYADITETQLKLIKNDLSAKQLQDLYGKLSDIKGHVTDLKNIISRKENKGAQKLSEQQIQENLNQMRTELIKKLDQVIALFSNTILSKSVEDLRSFQNIFKQSHLSVLNDDCISNVTLNLSRRDLKSLALTSKFFYKKIMPFVNKKLNPFMIGCGRSHTVILNEMGRLFACGSNSSSQIGLSSDKQIFTEIFLPEGRCPAQIAVGGQHTVILSECNVLFTCGQNIFDTQFEFGSISFMKELTKVQLPTEFAKKEIVEVKAGVGYTLVLFIDATVLALGDLHFLNPKYKEFKQEIDNSEQVSFFQIDIPKVDKIFAGSRQAMFLDKKTNSLFLLNDGLHKVELPVNKVALKVELGEDHVLIICEDSSVLVGKSPFGKMMPNTSFTQLILPDKRKPIDIAAGYYGFMVLCEDGSVFTLGDNSKGHLGLGPTQSIDTPTQIPLKDKAIALADLSTNLGGALILCEGNKLYGFGSNSSGQLGTGSKEEVVFDTYRG